MTPHEITVPSTCICGKQECEIPYGLCHCGCGEKTNIAKETSAARKGKAGWPRRYIGAHANIKRPKPEIAAPFKIDGVYCRLIPLTRGQYAIVDATDYNWLMQWSWCARHSKCGFYAERDARGISMHREILGLKKGDALVGDHINGNTLDNRRNNLRLATDQQNCSNQRIGSANTSGFKGVSWCKKSRKWKAGIVVYYKQIHLGFFVTKELAYAAYCAAAVKYHRDFARVA